MIIESETGSKCYVFLAFPFIYCCLHCCKMHYHWMLRKKTEFWLSGNCELSGCRCHFNFESLKCRFFYGSVLSTHVFFFFKSDNTFQEVENYDRRLFLCHHPCQMFALMSQNDKEKLQIGSNSILCHMK
jgi:hypothetical protein